MGLQYPRLPRLLLNSLHTRLRGSLTAFSYLRILALIVTNSFALRNERSHRNRARPEDRIPTTRDRSSRNHSDSQLLKSARSLRLSPFPSCLSCPGQLPRQKNRPTRDQRIHRLNPPTTLFHTQVLCPSPHGAATHLLNLWPRTTARVTPSSVARLPRACHTP